MKIDFRFWIVLFDGLIMHAVVYAQEIPYITNFKHDQYKGMQQNWSIAQAPNGYMYVGNGDGLLEYNGTAWKTYRLPKNEVVRAVYCGPDKKIYTGAYKEFGFWENNRAGTLAYHSLIGRIRNTSGFQEEIWNIIPLGHDILFQSFAKIFVFNGKGVYELKTPGNIMFMKCIDGRYLLPVIDQGIYELAEGRFHFLAGSEAFKGMTITALLRFNKEQLLVGTSDNGLFLQKQKTFVPLRTPLNVELKQNQLNRAIRLDNGNFAFGTIRSGLYITDSSTGKIIFHISKRNGLQNNTILNMVQDKRLSLWLTLDKGLTLVHLHSPLTYYTPSEGEMGTVYTATLFNGVLYLGTNEGVFYKRWMHDSGEGSPFHFFEGTQGQVWKLAVESGVLLCGHNNGTFEIKDPYHIHKISNVTGGWCLSKIMGRPDLIVQGSYTGLVLFKKQGTDWHFYKKIKGYDGPIKNLMQDKSGIFWSEDPYHLVTMMRLSRNVDSVVFTHRLDRKDGFTAGEKQSITNLRDKVLVGQGNTFYSYDPRSNRFLAVTALYTPSEKRLQKLIQFGPSGVFKVYKDRVGVYEKPPFYGLPTFSIPVTLIKNEENILPIDNTNYLLCLDDGYALWNKEKRFSRSYDESPSLTGVEAFSSKDPLGKKVFNAVKDHSVSVPPLKNHVVVSYTLPDFEKPPLFQYRLLGLSENWSGEDEQNAKEFISLAPGSYTFQVRSNENNKITQVSFTIEPQWYDRWDARIGFTVIGIVLVLILLKLNHSILEKRHKALQKEKDDRLLRQQMIMESQAMQLQNEKLKEEVIHKSQELSNSAMMLIKKNDILNDIKEELNLSRKDKEAQVISSNDHYRKIIRYIDTNLSAQQDWKVFENNFNEVHDEFFHKLKRKYPSITPTELKLAACLKMNLSSKEIAPILNISVRGVEIKRYRLRKKLNLSDEVNLNEHMMAV